MFQTRDLYANWLCRLSSDTSTKRPSGQPMRYVNDARPRAKICNRKSIIISKMRRIFSCLLNLPKVVDFSRRRTRGTNQYVSSDSSNYG